MAITDGFFLTPDDRDDLRDLLAEWRRGNLSIKNRPAVPEELGQAPEVYLAWPHADIPALAEATTGTASDDTPGSAICGIHRLVDVFSVPISVVPSPVADKLLYNFSAIVLPKHKWLLAVRDKYGTWVAVPFGDSTDSHIVDLIKRVGFHARLTSSNGLANGLTTQWNFQRMTLSGTSRIDDPDYAVTTGYPAVPHPLDGAVISNPFVGMRVWMWESKSSGKYEFLPVGPADLTHPGIVSLDDQFMGNGDKTFNKGVRVEYLARYNAPGTTGYSSFIIYAGVTGTSGDQAEAVTWTQADDGGPTFRVGNEEGGYSATLRVLGAALIGKFSAGPSQPTMDGSLSVVGGSFTSGSAYTLAYPVDSGVPSVGTAIKILGYDVSGFDHTIYTQPTQAANKGGIVATGLRIAGPFSSGFTPTGGLVDLDVTEDVKAGIDQADFASTGGFWSGPKRGLYDYIYYTDYRDGMNKQARFRGGIWVDTYSEGHGTGTGTSSPVGPPPPPPPPIKYYCVVPNGQDCSDAGASFSCTTSNSLAGFTVCSGPYDTALDCAAVCGALPTDPCLCHTTLIDTAVVELTVFSGPHAGSYTGPWTVGVSGSTSAHASFGTVDGSVAGCWLVCTGVSYQLWIWNTGSVVGTEPPDQAVTPSLVNCGGSSITFPPAPGTFGQTGGGQNVTTSW